MSETLLTIEKYLLFRGTAFTLDPTVLSVLVSALGCPTWSSAAVTFVVSTVFVFFTQMRYIFRSNALIWGAMVRYSIPLAADMAFTAVAVDRFDSWWGAYVQGKIFSAGIMTLWNYFITKHWVFPCREEGSGRRRRSWPWGRGGLCSETVALWDIRLPVEQAQQIRSAARPDEWLGMLVQFVVG